MKFKTTLLILSLLFCTAISYGQSVSFSNKSHRHAARRHTRGHYHGAGKHKQYAGKAKAELTRLSTIAEKLKVAKDSVAVQKAAADNTSKSITDHHATNRLYHDSLKKQLPMLQQHMRYDADVITAQFKSKRKKKNATVDSFAVKIGKAISTQARLSDSLLSVLDPISSSDNSKDTTDLQGVINGLNSSIAQMDSVYAQITYAITILKKDTLDIGHDSLKNVCNAYINELKVARGIFENTEVFNSLDTIHSYAYYAAYSFRPDTIQTLIDSGLARKNDSIALRVQVIDAIIVALRETVNNRIILPAYYSLEAIRFYTEKDTLVSKFFANNTLLYSGTLQKLTYGSELYSDYFGPVRLGIGYAISSASNSSDSNHQAQSDAIQQIIANGGNLNYNLSFPLMDWEPAAALELKVNFAHTGGVDIPEDSASASTYGYLSCTGINANLYSHGFNNVISIFATGRLSYVLGNKNFQRYLNENSFWLTQVSLGVAIKDNYRFRIDMYDGIGATTDKFIRNNFPVTLSFDIINPFSGQ